MTMVGHVLLGCVQFMLDDYGWVWMTMLSKVEFGWNSWLFIDYFHFRLQRYSLYVTTDFGIHVDVYNKLMLILM